MIKRALYAMGICVLAANVAAAQAGSIRGLVRDSLDRPMPNAEVTITPGDRRQRTDSAGRFAFESIGSGKYVVRARRVGYSPAEFTVELNSGGHADVKLSLGPRYAALDTVFVHDGRPCPAQTYEGFICRRATVKATFLDYTDIDSMNVLYSAELLRDIGGFTVEVIPTRNGPTRIASSRHCTTVLLNGILAQWHQVPEHPDDINAVEIYKTPKEVPKEFARFTWGRESCWLVAYWTYNHLKPVKKVALPRPLLSVPGK